MKNIGWSLGLAAAMVLVASHAQAQTGSSSTDKGSTTTGATSSSGMGTSGSSTNQSMGSGSMGATSGHFDTLKGRVQSFDRSNSTLTLSGSSKMLKVDPSTQVMKDGSRASIDDIKEGEQVRASFGGSGDTPHAQTIEIITNGANGAAAGTGSPAGSSRTSTGTGATGSGSMNGSTGANSDLSTGSGTGTGAQSGSSVPRNSGTSH